MVEIFTIAANQSGAASRSVSDDIRLSVPSDVYFGSGVAGIAFYEKSGADLKVTLLDGREVMIRDFFVIGPAGEYSRLRDGGAAGTIEVTGLIAPEPFVPQDPAARTEVAEVEKAPPAESARLPGNEETVIDVSVGADAPAAAPQAAVAEATGNAGFAFAGMPLDQALFVASMSPVAVVMVGGSDDDDAPAVAAAPFPAPTEDVVATDETGDAGEAAPIDSESLEMLTAILSTDDEDGLLVEDGTADPVAFVDDTGTGAFGDTGADLLAALVGDLAYSPPLG
ncbi:hypothetical protein [Pseudogemmobacter sonorensis]|uniref:hypothetical protein n=1 Tax=Pseudogemmobacter sonorensis TaxID=2989681 RepID=UPI0036C1508B